MARVRIESLAHGPQGVAWAEGRPCLVRGVAPGDEVEIAVREDLGSRAYADLLRVIRPGWARRTPPCRHVPECGSCSWQQVDGAAQAHAKERAIVELLPEQGGIERPVVLPILRPGTEYGYRRRLDLRVAGSRVGFPASGSREVLPVEGCLLAAPELTGAITVGAAWVRELATIVKRLEIAATGERDRFALVAQAQGRFAPEDEARTRALLGREARVACIVMHGRGWRHTWGDEQISVGLPDGSALRLCAGSFVQVNDAANAVLVRTVLEFTEAGPGQRTADLYAGAGNLSLPLARRAGRVIAVERAPRRAAAARDNARRLGLANLEVVQGDVARVIGEWAGRGTLFDTVVLDPPRSGAGAALDALARLGARRIVYASCNPVALARDVRGLAGSYRLERVQPIDFFPQTYHVEAVALLVAR